MTGSSESAEFPRFGRLLGIDFGTRRIGVAVSNDEQTISSPLENYDRGSEPTDLRDLTELAREYRACGLVVGLPVHMSGDEGGKAREARAFGEKLAQHAQLPLRFWDERFTSALADSYLLAADMNRRQRQARRDKLAAHIMLQSFLDAPDRDRRPPAY
jgi:putative Holliday junction resolvase